jgi:hypothetical protein
MDKDTLVKWEKALDEIEVSGDFIELRKSVVDLWKLAVDLPEQHREVLAMIDNALLSSRTLNKNQEEIIKTALYFLKFSVITDPHVSLMSEYFVEERFNPLASLGGNNKDNADG